MDLGLKGRRALVMGGTKGLGRSIADSLAAEGASLVISGRDQGRLDQAAAELRAAGAASAVGFPGDVANPDDMNALYAAAVQAMGGVDILVLNHGGPPPCTATEMKEADLTKWFTSIVVSPLRMAGLALPSMRAQKFGRVIVVGSTGMQHPIPYLALSNTLRASVWAWVKTMSGEVAEDGVTINVLAPGSILTDRTQETATKNAAAKGTTVEAIIQAGAKEIPARRYGMPAEYGPMGAFLAGDTGSYITGSMIRIDGGRVRGMV